MFFLFYSNKLEVNQRFEFVYKLKFQARYVRVETLSTSKSATQLINNGGGGCCIILNLITKKYGCPLFIDPNDKDGYNFS